MPRFPKTALPAAIAGLSLGLAGPACAQEVLLAAGWTGVNHGEDAPGVFVEGRLRVLPLLDTLDLAAGAVAGVDIDGDLFLGVGPVLRWSFLPGWRADASFMPGFYEEGGGLDLGSSIEFRSSVALSRAVGERTRIGLAYSHISNASIAEHNPGEDSVWLFVAFSL